MTPTKKQLDELFGSVAGDTPSLERNELHTLLGQGASGNQVLGPLQTSIISRRRGIIKRGIYTMSITAILITACIFFFSHTTEVKDHPNSTPKSISSSIGNEKNSDNTQTPLKEENEKESGSKVKDSIWHYLGFEPIDLSCVMPVAISPDDMNKVGLFQADSGEIIMFHSDNKIGFPVAEKLRSYNAYKDPRTKSFRDLALYPSYVTDSKGNLLMMYKYTNNGGSKSTEWRTFDDIDEVKILNSNYYRTMGMSSEEFKVDSSQTPWIITNKYHFRVGIMALDTTMSHAKDDENRDASHAIIEILAQQDSLYKMKFGGQHGLAEKFQFSTDYTKLSKQEQAIIDSLSKIEKKQADRKTMLRSQIHYLNSLLDGGKTPDLLKLKVEQLSYKIDYEWYALDHKEQEEKLANITSLVPIQVRENTGMKATGTYDNGLIFWYEPSKELFKALPQLQQQLSAEACTQNKDQKLQSVSLYPNPANMYLFVNYTLSSSTNVSISILNLLGKVIAENISSHMANAGVNKESITLGDIPPGVYIVLLKTDSGEQSIQRLAVTR